LKSLMDDAQQRNLDNYKLHVVVYESGRDGIKMRPTIPPADTEAGCGEGTALPPVFPIVPPGFYPQPVLFLLTERRRAGEYY